MPAAERTDTAPLPLTALSEDEKLFQTTVRRFARERIRPYVREMDAAGVFRQNIIEQFFEMGLMGIEIPEEYGGQGRRFFQAGPAGGGALPGGTHGGGPAGGAHHHLQK